MLPNFSCIVFATISLDTTEADMKLFIINVKQVQTLQQSVFILFFYHGMFSWKKPFYKESKWSESSKEGGVWPSMVTNKENNLKELNMVTMVTNHLSSMFC